MHMYDTEETVLPSTKPDAFYKILLLVYPEPYRKHFGEQMLFAFEDMYQAELEKHGKIRLGFWFSIFLDTTESVITEHINMIKKQGIKNYLNINKYNVIGGILLLPFVLILGSDFIGRVVQGDFSHPNMGVVGFLSRSVLYGGYDKLLWAILVFAPLMAAILNLIPVISSLKRKKEKLTISTLLFTSPLSLLIVGMGLLFILIEAGHDAVPCFVNHLISNGLGNIWQTILVCKNA